MALNFTVSYTFSPSTTISSSQVNTNTSDVASVFQGLEAKTKSLAALQIDATPTVSADAVIKSYVDKLNSYRRPVLQYSSSTVVNIETGINGTSGQAQILFSDGTLRTDSTSGRINCNLAQVAALSGSAQSGLRTGSVSNNTWYAIYAVKVTDSSTNFVTVADTVLPLQANYATLNSNFGTNGWVYLGMCRNGDGDGSASGILKFIQAGNMTVFYNPTAGGSSVVVNAGIKFAASASTTALAYTYAAGTGTTQIPNHLTVQMWSSSMNATAGAINFTLRDGTIGVKLHEGDIGSNNKGIVRVVYPLVSGNTVELDVGSACPLDINLVGYWDSVLGIGANPIL